MEFYRGELVRQRDFLREIWRWYLGPLIPGPAWLVVGAAWPTPAICRTWRFLGGYALVAALAFFLIAQINLKAAGRLQKRIED